MCKRTRSWGETIASSFIPQLLKFFPDLAVKLRSAKMPDTPKEFLTKTLMFAMYGSIAFGFLAFLFTKGVNPWTRLLVMLGITLISFFLLFNYVSKLPDMTILKKSRDIDREIVFAIRFIIIEVESGVPIYNLLKNMISSYEHIGETCREIVERVNMGTSLEEALNEAVEYCPSDDFRKVLWQVMNSIRTGSDVSKPLRTVLDQVIRKQQIMVNEYGRKLNPLAMFYMMIAVIIPSLGITFLMLIVTFIGLKLSLDALLLIAVAVGFMQFVFYVIIKSSRPAVDL